MYSLFTVHYPKLNGQYKVESTNAIWSHSSSLTVIAFRSFCRTACCDGVQIY
jgi:hypothetical protein